VTGQTGARQIAGEFGFPGCDARGFSPFSRGTDGKHLEFGGVEFAGRSPPRDQYEFGSVHHISSHEYLCVVSTRGGKGRNRGHNPR
jgi:hypothetical protein